MYSVKTLVPRVEAIVNNFATLMNAARKITWPTTVNHHQRSPERPDRQQNAAAVVRNLNSSNKTDHQKNTIWRLSLTSIYFETL